MSIRDRSTPAWAARALALALLATLSVLFHTASAHAEEFPNHPFNKLLISGFKKETETKQKVAELEDPCGVTVGSAGEIYVSDYRNRELRGPSRLNSEGGLEFRTTLKFDPDNGACGMAIDDEGNLYVNFWHGAVVKYTPNIYPPPGPGEPQLLYTTEVIYPGQATGVAVDPRNGDVVVNERTGIAVYAAPVEATDVPTMLGVGSLKNGYGVAISTFPETEGQIYAGDAADHTVKVYDPAGDPTEPARTINGAGTPQGRFVSLVDAALATDQIDGHVFVTDNTQPGFKHPAAVVDEFTHEGLYRGQLGRPLIDGEPVGIGINETPTGKRGEIYVTTGNGTALALPVEEGTPASEQSALLAFGGPGPGQKLNVTKSGTGTGLVTSTPAGISCGEACEAEFNEGALVTLTASPHPGSEFAGWSGPCAGTTTCQVTMETAYAVDAQFVPAPAAFNSAPAPSTDAAHSATVAGPPAPATLRIGRASARGESTVDLRATVAGPGMLTATGPDLKPAAATLGAAGPTTLHLHLRRSGRRALAKSKTGRLAMRVALTFAPSSGAPAGSATKIVTFRRR
jgi:hypothetical protein